MTADEPMTEIKKSGFWDRAIRNLRGAWEKIASDGDSFTVGSLSPDLSDNDRERLVEQMQACLEARGGEVSARSRAAALGHAYLALNETGRKRFVGVLADEFDVDKIRVDAAVQALAESEDTGDRFKAEQNLRKALEAPRLKLLTQFNALPEGVKFLVDMRTELIDWVREDKSLAGVEADLKALLASWFDVGFLELKQITWQAPAALLEKLFVYEAVHEIRDWDDLKNRLASDRRCFAYFHPRMPDEPLIFVWVALVNGMSSNVQELLDESAPLGDAESADTAIFYSISNAQAGLKGINFGNFLIKRVVGRLSAELDGLKRFATLSPIPGFMNWLDQISAAGGDDYLLGFLSSANAEKLMGAVEQGSPEAALKECLARPHWYEDDKIMEALKDPILQLCAHYLVNEKRGHGKSTGTALDSVAHFHLNNGARVEQLNWAADLSTKGLTQSVGVMLNYLYEVDDIEANHESYRSGKEVIASSAVLSLLK